MNNYQIALLIIVAMTTLGTLLAVALIRGGKHPEEVDQERSEVNKPTPKPHRASDSAFRNKNG